MNIDKLVMKKLYYLMMRGTGKQAIDKDGNPLLIFTDEPCRLELQYTAKLVEKENINFYMNIMNQQNENNIPIQKLVSDSIKKGIY